MNSRSFTSILASIVVGFALAACQEDETPGRRAAKVESAPAAKIEARAATEDEKHSETSADDEVETKSEGESDGSADIPFNVHSDVGFITENEEEEQVTERAPRAPEGTVTIYRHYLAQPQRHDLRTSPIAEAPWVAEGEVFLAFAEGDGVPNRRPLLRCLNLSPYRVMPSIDTQCEGQAVAERVAYVATSPEEGMVELVRCSDPTHVDHLAVINVEECKRAGYQIDGGIGFVHPLVKP